MKSTAQTRPGVCQCSTHMKNELSMAAMALFAAGALAPGDKVPDDLVN